MIKIVCVGKVKDKNLSNLINDYCKKINSYHRLSIIEVKDEPIIGNLTKSILDREANSVLKNIKNNEYVILLDLHGKQKDSIEFAKDMQQLFNRTSDITFVIGGSLGVGDSLIKRSNERLSLSKMTFLHQMTRLILIEQIYRSFKINNNEIYHK